MNLISGVVVNREESLAALDNLHESIGRTLSAGELSVQRVISACDALSGNLTEERCMPTLLALGMSRQRVLGELVQARTMLSREYTEARLTREFGEIPGAGHTFVPYGLTGRVTEMWRPLGVLLHISAGNVDALPFMSVIEGLLTGNINILKLPGVDDGLSVPLLRELIAIEPLIADYVYVFDYPSTDTELMGKLAQAASAIVVWGGDAAVSAVRQAAHPDTKIIEWGHKISFAYVSGSDVPEESLEGIAVHICETDQLYCNSCQGIYLDTENTDEVFRFAERFLGVLERVASAMPRALSVPVQAQKTLELYTEELESVSAPKKVFRTPGCSVIAYGDSRLQPSYMFRNCWVRPLPEARIITALLPCKNHLHTAALVCGEEDRARLQDTLLKAGIVRITSGRNMSKNYCGLPHDGEYALRRYMKRVSLEYDDRQ